MDHDEKPLPTNVYRRRSLFDDESREHNQSFKDFPEEKSDIIYPKEYVEKVTSELEQWNMHIEKILKENHKIKNEEMELKNTVLDENILTAEQYEVFSSLDIDGYMRRVKEFFDRVMIFSHIVQHKTETETEYHYIAAQKKIEKEVLRNVRF